MNNQHEIILKTKRNNIDDCLYWGSYYFAREDKIILSKGHNEKSIIFMRSLAKPLQAAVMCDYNIIEDFKLTSKELAVFCASHAGSLKHVELLKKIIKKHGIKISNFELMPQKPLDTRYYNNHKTKLCNNCSGKHLMMILMSKYLNFDIKNYINKNHPLQKLIYKKQEELSCYKSSYLTYDGCGTPLWGLPVENVIKAYFNFFKNKKYSPLILSILKNPYIFGGYDRLDTEIIKLSKGKLFSKVGAGGKRLLRKTIAPLIPANIKSYIKPFGGGVWILFYKDKWADLEIYNDLYGRLVNLFRIVKYHPNAFKEELQYLLGSREMFLQFLNGTFITDIQKAVQFYFLITRSFGGRGGTFGTVKKCSGGASKSQKNVLDRIDAIHERLDKVLIENKERF